MELPADPSALATALEARGYLADVGLATAAHLALHMHRPLFLEGDAGVGKTSLAQALAEVLDAELVRLQCYEGIDVSQALYDWDFRGRSCTCAPPRAWAVPAIWPSSSGRCMTAAS